MMAAQDIEPNVSAFLQDDGEHMGGGVQCAFVPPFKEPTASQAVLAWEKDVGCVLDNGEDEDEEGEIIIPVVFKRKRSYSDLDAILQNEVLFDRLRKRLLK